MKISVDMIFRKTAWLLVMISGFTPALWAGRFFASPQGTAAGNGSMASTWDLQTALNQPASFKAGDTLFLRAGTYAGFFTSRLQGTAGKYIAVMPYAGERAIIQDNRAQAAGATLQVNGAWCIYKDLEITNSSSDRSSSGAGSFRPMGLQIVAPYTKFINLYIHDTGHGMGFWKEAVHAEVYGCIITNCGTKNSPGNYATHGHGIYTQNDTGIKVIANNIIGYQFGFGLHAYPNPGHVNGYRISGNVFFDNGIQTGDTVRYNNILVNTYPPYTLKNIDISGNYTYDSRTRYTYKALIEADLQIGATNADCSRLSITQNYFMGRGRAGLAVLRWDSVVFEKNTTYYRHHGTAAFVLQPGSAYAAHRWNSNTYYQDDSFPGQFSLQYGPLTTYSGWKTATGFDASSRLIAHKLDSLRVFILPSKYDAGRAHIVVYNWPRTPDVFINLKATGLEHGQAFRLADAQNLYGSPAYSGIFDSLQPEITVRLSNLTPVAANGMPALKSTAPEFATLVCIPGAGPELALRPAPPGQTIRVHYNPDTRQLHVHDLSATDGAVGIQLYNMLGQKILEARPRQTGNENVLLNCSLVRPGLYLLHIDDGRSGKMTQVCIY